MSAEQDLGRERASTSLPDKTQGFSISAREPVWVEGRLQADIGLASEPFVPSCKVSGRWDPRVLGLGASLHLPTFCCALLGSRNSLVLLGGRVLGASELEWVTLHCVHDHIAHVGN